MSDDGPPEREIKDFAFHHGTKIRVSPSSDSMPCTRVSLLVASSSYGLIFVGSDKGFKVYRSSEILDKAVEQGHKATEVIEDFSAFQVVQTLAPPTHLALSRDSLTLAVCLHKNGFAFAEMYDVRAFASSNASVAPFLEIKLAPSGDDYVKDVAWNPGVDFANILAVCLSDGVVTLYEVTENLRIAAKSVITKAMPRSIDANCLCWSPKGKQLVVGKASGALAQYDQNLQLKRNIAAPDIFNGIPMTVVDILWESTHVFVAAMEPLDNNTNEQPRVIVITCPKDGAPIYADFEDPCYGGGEERKHHMTMRAVPEWDMVVMCSANSLECAVLGKSPENKSNWERWSLEDTARAELPMTEEYQETYPVGMAIEHTANKPIPLPDNKSHQASPLLLLLSTDGVLICFHMMNSRSGVPPLVSQPQPLSSQGERKSVLRTPQAKASASEPQRTQVSTPTSVSRSLFQAKPDPPSISQSSAADPKPPPYPASKPLTGFTLNASVNQSLNLGQPLGQSTPAPNQAISKIQKPEAALPAQSVFGKTGSTGSNSTPVKSIFGQSVNNQKPAQAQSPFGQVSSSNKTADGEKPSFSFGKASSTAQTSVFGGSTGRPVPGQPGSIFGGAGNQAQNVKTSGQSAFTFGGQATNQTAVIGSSGALSSFSFNATNAVTGSHATSSPTVPTPSTPQAAPQAIPQQQQLQPPQPGILSGISIGSGKQATPQPQSTTKQVAEQKPTAQIQPERSSQGQGQSQTGSVARPNLGQGQSQTVALASHKPILNRPDADVIKAGGKLVQQQVVDPAVGHDTEKTEDPFAKAIIEEMERFQKELTGLRSRSSLNVSEIGSKEQLVALRKNTESMKSFASEISEKTQAINGEIHELKTRCLESFATLEECKLREERTQHGSNKSHHRSRGLDPISERRLKEIHSAYQYIDSSIHDADRKLDAEWETYQNTKNNRRRMVVPASDTIYRTLSANQKIISEQQRHLEKLCGKLKDLRLYSREPARIDHRETLRSQEHLDSTPSSRGNTPRGVTPTSRGGTPRGATQRGAIPTSRGSTPARTDSLDDELSKISSPLVNHGTPPTFSMSPEKSAKLRDFLGNRKVTPIKCKNTSDFARANMMSMYSKLTSPSAPAQSPSSAGGQGTGLPRASDATSFWEQSSNQRSFGTIKSPTKSPTKSPQTPPWRPGGTPTGGTAVQRAPAGFPQQNLSQQALMVQLMGRGDQLPIGGALASAMGGSESETWNNPSTLGQFGSLSQSSGFKFADATSSQPGTFGGNLGSPAATTARPEAFKSATNKAVVENVGPPETPDNEQPPSPQQESSKRQSTISSGMSSAGFTGISQNTSAFSFGTSTKSTTAPAFDFGKSQSGKTAFSFGATSGGGSIFGGDKAGDGGSIFGGDKAAGAKNGFAFGKNASNSQNSTTSSLGFQTAEADSSEASNTPSSIAPTSLNAPAISGKLATFTTISSPSPQAFSFGASSQDTQPTSSTNLKRGIGIPDSTDNTLTSSTPTLSSFSFKNVTDSGVPSPTIQSPVIEKPADEDNSAVTNSGISLPASKPALQTGFRFASSSESPSITTPESPAAADSVFGVGPASSSSVFSKLPKSPVFGGNQVATADTNPVSSTTQPSSTKPGLQSGFRFRSEQPSVDSTPPAATISTGLSSENPAPSVSNQASVFGGSQSTSTTKSSIFGGAGVLGGGQSTSIFGGAPALSSTPVLNSTPESEKTPSVSSTSQSSISTAPATAATSTTTPSLFGQKSGATSVTSLQASKPALQTGFRFASSEAASPSFGQTQNSTVSSSSQEASSSSTTGSTSSVGQTTSTTSLFGQQPSQTATSGGSLFGQLPSTKGGFSFGQIASGSSGSTSIFGQQSATTSTTTTTTTTSQTTVTTTTPSIFGQSSGSATSIFGQSTATTTVASIFGQKPATTSTPSVFGQPSTTAVTSSSIFGQQAATVTASGTSVFGQPSATTSASSGGSVFGQPSSGLTAQAFGQQPPSSGSGAAFGGSAGFSSGFGSTSTSSGGFGTTSMFGGQAVFGQPSGGSVFGGSQAQPSAFGSGGSVFGQSSTSTAQTPVTTSSDAGSGGLFGSGGGGGLFGLGGKPSAENANKNVFGGSSSFGGTSPATALFGGQSSSSFGGSTDAKPASGGFSSSTFGNTGPNIASTGFGGFQQQTPTKPTTGGFGAAPAFGSPPSFGGGAVFGNQPAFGSSTAMTSSFGAGAAGGSVFGAGAVTPNTPSQQGGFAGFASASSPTFGALAQGGPATFGSVAQPSNPSDAFSAGGGGGSFGSPAFGGTQQQQQSPSGAAFTAYRG